MRARARRPHLVPTCHAIDGRSMKKLKLHLDDLQIDSFQTTPAEKPKGTVFGEQCTCYTQCTCPGCPTCDASCNGTCDATCPNTCFTCELSCRPSCLGTCDYFNPSCVYTNCFSRGVSPEFCM
jgi:hypothetical protein